MVELPKRQTLENAAKLVYEVMPPTPQYAWPLLGEALDMEVWVKHENHTPTGAFKARGGITFINWLRATHPEVKGIITATRGNHGQSQAMAASREGLECVVLVPEGNSTEKNDAMKGFGAELIIHGKDFDEARLEAERLAKERGLFIVPSFHHALVRGVASYGLELFSKVDDLDAVFVPIGCGSGICATIMAREALGLKTKIYGVVSENADSAKRSFDAGDMIETKSATTFADGMAVRVPVEEAFNIYKAYAEDIITVSDEQVADAIRLYYHATHNIAEGAGAAPLAALTKMRNQNPDEWRGKKVATILCGQNIDTEWFVKVMQGGTPHIKL